jgi:hypothetical protein
MASRFNCAPKFDERVKIPTREIIHNVFNDIKDLAINRVFAVDDFVKEIGEFIANRFSVNVFCATSPEVDPGDVNLNAYYDSEEDEACKISIDIVLITHPRETCIIFDKDCYKRFVNNLSDALAHELIHMKQARTRDFIEIDHRCQYYSDEGFEYLANPDEIDAYAHNIATELNDSAIILEKLNQPSKITIKESINLWVYFNVFGSDLTQPILRRLLKKVYKKLDK